MESLEDKLKRALEPTDAPGGFVERVIARCQQPAPTPKESPAWLALARSAWLWRPGCRPALAGAVAGAILFLSLGYWHHQANREFALRQERIRGEQTRAQLLLALHITGTQLTRLHNLLANAPHTLPQAPENRADPFTH